MKAFMFDRRPTMMPVATAVSLGALAILLLVIGATSFGYEASALTKTGTEYGVDDFRISNAGANDDFNVWQSVAAFNSKDNEYLVVWSGDDNHHGPVGTGREIYGQRIDAQNGLLLGEMVRISDMGPEDDSRFSADSPDVAYNPIDNQYLVVWSGHDDTGTLIRNKHEIFGQLLNADGSLEGANDFRISFTGLENDADYRAYDPAVAFNEGDQEFLVVWHGEGPGQPEKGDEDIFGQLLLANGAPKAPGNFRISDMGPEGSTDFDASRPDVTFNGDKDHYLVVWDGLNNGGGLATQEREIYGQLLDKNGAPEGANDFRISQAGGTGDPAYGAWSPSAAYNPTSKRFLVAWEAVHLVKGKLEIYAQLLSDDGLEFGEDDFLISRMGPHDVGAWSASLASIAVDPARSRFFVAWEGADDRGELTSSEFEIFGRWIDAATGQSLGDDDIRLSDMGPDGDPEFDALWPHATFNPTLDEFLVVWTANDKSRELDRQEREVYGQRVSAATEMETGLNDFRISAMGVDRVYDAHHPAIAFNPQANEYLVVWQADTNASGYADNELEIFGQRIDALTGEPVGASDFQISDMDPKGNNKFIARHPAVAYNPDLNQYLVVWEADNDISTEADDEYEIFGQLLDGQGGPIGVDDFRISHMGGEDGDARYDATSPDVAYDEVNGRFLVVWSGLHLIEEQYDEFEIYGQLLTSTGTKYGDIGFRISEMGPPGDIGYQAHTPAVAFDPQREQFLVVWGGMDRVGDVDSYEAHGKLLDAEGESVTEEQFQISSPSADQASLYVSDLSAVFNPVTKRYLVTWQGLEIQDEVMIDEIFGQLLTEDGEPVKETPFMISDSGVNGEPGSSTLRTSAAYIAETNEYLVLWVSDDSDAGLATHELEIFAQYLSAGGDQIEPNDLQISEMGPNGDLTYVAQYPALACETAANRCLAVWSGDDDRMGMIDQEFEIFGQFLGDEPPPPTPTPSPSPTPPTPPATATPPAPGGQGQRLFLPAVIAP